MESFQGRFILGSGTFYIQWNIFFKNPKDGKCDNDRLAQENKHFSHSRPIQFTGLDYK